MSKNKVNLVDSLNVSYGDKNSQKKIEQQGFIKDESLSNDNQTVFFNDKEKKLIFTVAGTHNLSDVGTDIYLASGNLKSTERYKSANKTLNKARIKYKPKEVVVTGHSLGGAIAQYIAKKNDKVVTYNKGATLGQKTRKNETAIRTRGDLVSLFGEKEKTLNSKNTFIDVLGNHNTKNLKKRPIFI
jgi:hypothetical protein